MDPGLPFSFGFLIFQPIYMFMVKCEMSGEVERHRLCGSGAEILPSVSLAAKVSSQVLVQEGYGEGLRPLYRLSESFRTGTRGEAQYGGLGEVSVQVF